MRKNQEKALIKNAEHVRNRIKETIRGNSTSPVIEKIHEFPGMTYASWGVMRRFTIERATKLYEYKDEYLRDLGLEPGAVDEDAVIDIEYFIVDTSKEEVVEYFIKSEHKIDQPNWQTLRKLHEIQIQLLKKEVTERYLKEESENPQAFVWTAKTIPYTNFIYRRQEYLWYPEKGEKIPVNSVEFHPQDFDDVKCLKDAAWDFHLTDLEKFKTFKIGDAYRVFELVIVDKAKAEEVEYIVLKNHYVPPMSTIIEDSFLYLPNLYKACWRNAKAMFESRN